MDKLTMAHDYFMKHVNTDQYRHLDDEDLISWSFDYVDAMQAEADKREKEKQDKAKQEQQNYEDALDSIGVEQWQPDWSQAPDWANWWVIGPLTKQGIWSETQPVCVKFNGVNYWEVTSPSGDEHLSVAPSFKYRGNWQNSLRKRP